MLTASDINAKISEYMNSPKGRDKVREYINSPSMASAHSTQRREAIEILAQLIMNYAPPSISSSVKLEVVSELIDVSNSSGNSYYVNLNFDKSLLPRPSLGPNAGAYDIVGLFTKGWDIESSGGMDKRVRGLWHGGMYWNKLHKEPDDFIQRAVDAFMGMYAIKYGVLECNIDPRYLSD